MNKENKSIHIVAISMFFFLVGLFSPGMTIGVDFEASWNFGDVAVGSSSNATVSVSTTANEELILTSFILQTGVDYKVVTAIPYGGIPISPNEILNIEIAFSPINSGNSSDVLYIYTNNPLLRGKVSLTGIGVESKSEIAIEDILDFFDSSVFSGDLMGNESNRSGNNQLYAYQGKLEPVKKSNTAENRLKAFRNMLKSAAKMIDEENVNGACEQLLDIYKKTDGHSSVESPPDFVKGQATEELAAMIADYRQQLNCR